MEILQLRKLALKKSQRLFSQVCITLKMVSLSKRRSLDQTCQNLSTAMMLSKDASLDHASIKTSLLESVATLTMEELRPVKELPKICVKSTLTLHLISRR